MSAFTENTDLELLRRKSRYLEVIHEFALSQVNLNTLDEILWNVAKTAIAKLGFVDCVIYLLANDNLTLVQRAAHGPKNPVAQDILNPITIRVGEGVVGSVAKTGKVERIADTRKDPRYIADDANRLSELAVPLIRRSKIIGVLDSEHPDTDFFTEEHVQLLTTIAALASTRIDTAIVMERLESTISRLRNTEQHLEIKAEELQQAKLRAEQASSEKSLFLANMSHEIRTPMTSIVGYADLLTRPDKSPEEKNEWAQQLRRNADHLLGLMNDVLDMSKIESGQLQPDIDNCELNVLILDVCSLMRPHAVSKGLEFSVDIKGPLPLSIRTDALRLRQTLVNLISNAIKFTERGSITLGIHSTASINSGQLELIFQLEDTGIGIEADMLDQVFEPFVQANRGSQSSFGTGLGLSISRRFAKLLGGDLKAESRVGRGSKFILSIDAGPLDETVCVAPHHFELGTKRQENRKSVRTKLDGVNVHVVEDTLSVAMLIRHLLKDAGATVSYSDNGEKGIQDIFAAIEDGRSPDLILMDMMMPVMDGYTATSILRENGVKTPVVALTAFTFQDDREKCLAAGCNLYISKPINPVTFIDQLKDCLPG